MVNPIIAAICSLIIPGLGQLIEGQETKKSITFLAIFAVLWILTFFIGFIASILLLIFAIYAAYDAYKFAAA